MMVNQRPKTAGVSTTAPANTLRKPNTGGSGARSNSAGGGGGAFSPSSGGGRKKERPLVGLLPKGWKPAKDDYDDMSDHKLWQGDIHEEKNMEVYEMIQENKLAREAHRRVVGDDVEGAESDTRSQLTASSMSMSFAGSPLRMGRRASSLMASPVGGGTYRGDYLTRFYEEKRQRSAGNVRSVKSADVSKTFGGRIAIGVSSERRAKQQGSGTGGSGQRGGSAPPLSPSYPGRRPSLEAFPFLAGFGGDGGRRTSLPFGGGGGGADRPSTAGGMMTRVPSFGRMGMRRTSSRFDWGSTAAGSSADFGADDEGGGSPMPELPEGPCSPVKIEGIELSQLGSAAAQSGTPGNTLHYMKYVLDEAKTKLSTAKQEVDEVMKRPSSVPPYARPTVRIQSAGGFRKPITCTPSSLAPTAAPGEIASPPPSIPSAGKVDTTTTSHLERDESPLVTALAEPPGGRLTPPPSTIIVPEAAGAAAYSPSSSRPASCLKRKTPDDSSSSSTAPAPGGAGGGGRVPLLVPSVLSLPQELSRDERVPPSGIDVEAEGKVATGASARLVTGGAGGLVAKGEEKEEEQKKEEGDEEDEKKAVIPPGLAVAITAIRPVTLANLPPPRYRRGLPPRTTSSGSIRRSASSGMGSFRSTRSALAARARPLPLTDVFDDGPPEGKVLLADRSGSIVVTHHETTSPSSTTDNASVGSPTSGVESSAEPSPQPQQRRSRRDSLPLPRVTSGGVGRPQSAGPGPEKGRTQSLVSVTAEPEVSGAFTTSPFGDTLALSMTIPQLPSPLASPLSEAIGGKSPSQDEVAKSPIAQDAPFTFGFAPPSLPATPRSGQNSPHGTRLSPRHLSLTSLPGGGMRRASRGPRRKKEVRMQDTEGVTFLLTPKQRGFEESEGESASDMEESDEEDKEDYEALKELLHRHTQIARGEDGSSVLLLAEDDVAGLWPFEIEAAALCGKIEDEEENEPEAQQPIARKESWEEPTGSGFFAGEGRQSRTSSIATSVDSAYDDRRSSTGTTFGFETPALPGMPGMQIGFMAASQYSPRRLSSQSGFSGQSGLSGGSAMSGASIGTVGSVTSDVNFAAKFNEALVSFNPKVRLLDGLAPGTANLGAAILRKKIYRLERDAPVDFPRIKVELIGTPRMKRGFQRTASGRIIRPTSIRSSASDHSSAKGSAVSDASSAISSIAGGSQRSPLGRKRSNMQDMVAVGDMTPEGATYFPPQDLHLYQLFSKQAEVLLIFRPVSPALPSMYAGDSFVPLEFCDANGIPLMLDEIKPPLTMEEIDAITTHRRRVRGKGIQVSLKSSPYAPIEGFIPVNTHLSKTYSEAAKKARALEDQLIKAAERNKSTSLSIMRRMQKQQTAFGSSAAVAMREIQEKITESRQQYDELFEEYHEKSIHARNKLEVSLEYIDRFNEAQFLGTTSARWRGMLLYYKQFKGEDDLEREGKTGSAPLFFARRADYLMRYERRSNELDTNKKISFDAEQYHEIEILTHRSFVISPVCHRIEPDPEGDFIIGPDFDGLAYSPRLPAKITCEQYIHFCVARTYVKLVRSMGLVSNYDVEHVLEMRRLTEWKQNHGYENGNLVKTQELGPGNYTVVSPKGVKVLRSFIEIINYYREAWTDGFPLQLNPNWKVVLQPGSMMPYPYPYEPDDIFYPIVDDCGMALLKNNLSNSATPISFDDLKDEAKKYLEDAHAYIEKHFPTSPEVSLLGQQQHHHGLHTTPASAAANVPPAPKRRPPVNYNHPLTPDLAMVLARKDLAEDFYRVRTWQLMPPFLGRTERNIFLVGVAQNTKLDEEFESFRFLNVLDLSKKFYIAADKFDKIFPDDGGQFATKLRTFVKPSLGLIGEGKVTSKAEEANIVVDYLRPVVDETPEFFGESGSSNEPQRRLRLQLLNQ